jgi:sugar lactone lactonase YvrE
MRVATTILSLLALAAPLLAQDVVTTLAGQSLVSGATNGVGTNAAFSDPAAIVVAANGNYFLADSRNHAIRQVTTNGVVSTFAGQLGVAGTANGKGTAAQFNYPSGLAFDRSGNLFVSDTGNNTIRKITANGTVSTLAGVAGSSGFLDTAVVSALFNAPLGIAVWTNGTIFVADSGNHCLRKIVGGIVTTFAGTPQVWGSSDGVGTNAQFNAPCGLALDASGNLFVSDANNHTIRKVATNGVVSTIAGAAGQDGASDGDSANARFRNPAELVFDLKGNLFVADSFNQTIRKISTNGTVSKVSGAVRICSATNGANGLGKFFNPYGIAVAANGSLVVADTYNELVRVVLVPFTVTLQATGNPAARKISWDSIIGKVYQVQVRGALTADWTNLGSVLTATNFTSEVTDISTAVAARFYRVLLQ